MLDSLRTGAWLTRERVRTYCGLLLVGYVLTVAALLLTSNGKVDFFHRPLGSDFSEVYAAGVSVLRGQPAAPFDNAAHYETQKAIFGDHALFFAWSYPPYFLGLAALLALLPYLGALAIWQGASFAICFSAVARCARDKEWLLPILAFPGSFINLLNGQNGFLTAGLYAWSLMLLERRPVIAGALIGLLSYKPQFGVLIPLALIAGGYWRSIMSAATTIALMTIATWIGFGAPVWRGFLASTTFARVVMTERGGTGFAKIQTVFSSVRQIGGSVESAYAAQIVAGLLCAAIVIALWSRRVDWRLKSAALMVGALLTTPYALDYDLVLLGPALAFVTSYVAERGARNWEKTALAVVWAAPFFARLVSMLVHVSVGSVAAAVLMAALWRAAAGRDTIAPIASPAAS